MLEKIIIYSSFDGLFLIYFYFSFYFFCYIALKASSLVSAFQPGEKLKGWELFDYSYFLKSHLLDCC